MANPVKRLAVLGSTGSIGKQTLEIIRRFPERFHVTALAAGENLQLLSEQIAEFRPALVSYRHDVAKPPLPEGEYRLLSLEGIAGHPEVDLVVLATSGRAGLAPLLAAIESGKTIALANKEALVMAGEIITARLKNSSARILPLDSEHSAIWQCLNNESQPAARLILTASGGPFRNHTAEQLVAVSVAEALKHPSWRMGKKVTIDSATLMNKGLEVIEAHWLFDMPYDKIEVVIHPQSIIHSMVEFSDGTLKAQLSRPDMRFPIQYALTYPERVANPELPLMSWNDIQFTFEQPDTTRFPCLGLAIEAGRRGDTFPAAVCAADEVAVSLFLDNRIGFTDIPRLIAQVLDAHQPITNPSLDNILEADAWARGEARQLAERIRP